MKLLVMLLVVVTIGCVSVDRVRTLSGLGAVMPDTVGVAGYVGQDGDINGAWVGALWNLDAKSQQENETRLVDILDVLSGEPQSTNSTVDN